MRDLFAAGADIVQLDEPYLQARPEPARAYGVKALNRALDGVVGTTAVHLCFGYAAIIHERPSGYSFLPELADCSCDQISIETAQSNLDTSVLTHLAGKKIMLGVIDLSTPAVESVDTVAERVRRALPYVAPENVIIATDCGMKYLPRDAAEGKMRAMAAAAAMLRHLARGGRPRQVLHAAVGRDHELLRRHVRQRPAHPVGHRRRPSRPRGRQVDHAEHDRLAGEGGQHDGSSPDCAVSIETWSQGSRPARAGTSSPTAARG